MDEDDYFWDSSSSSSSDTAEEQEAEVPDDRKLRVRPSKIHLDLSWFQEASVNHRLIDDLVEYDDPNWSLDRAESVRSKELERVAGLRQHHLAEEELWPHHHHHHHHHKVHFHDTAHLMKHYNERTYAEDKVHLSDAKASYHRQVPQLGFWDHRGRAQPVRLMFAYVEHEYEERSFSRGPPPSYHRSNWDDVKDSLGLEVPKLPYYIFKNVRLSGCLPIVRHFAREFDLAPETHEETTRVLTAEYHCYDLTERLQELVHSSNVEYAKVEYPDRANFKHFADFLDERYWVAGVRLTYVDFLMYEILKQHTYIKDVGMESFRNLYRYMQRFEELPTIHKYLMSPAYKIKMYPLHGDRAKFGSANSKRPKTLD